MVRVIWLPVEASTIQGFHTSSSHRGSCFYSALSQTLLRSANHHNVLGSNSNPTLLIMFALPFAPHLPPPLVPPVVPAWTPPYGPPQQLLGRDLRPRRALGNPLKHSRGSQHLCIESPMTNSIWPIRQRRLARHMPGLLQKMRESGNRIMNPLDLVPCETFQDQDDDPFVLDLLMNGLARRYPATLFGLPSPTGGLDLDDYFLQLYALAFQFGTINVQAINDILTTFRKLSSILKNDSACGFGVDIYTVVAGWAIAFMPIIGGVPGAIYTLIESLYVMTCKDEYTLRTLVARIPFQYQGQVLTEAQQRSIMEQSFLAQNIIEAYLGLPLTVPM